MEQNHPVTIGIDIGGTHFRIGMAGESGHAERFEKVPTSSVMRSDDVLSDLAAFIADYARGARFDAVAIGFPATLDRERKTVLQAPNLKFMEKLPVTAVLGERLGVPVFAERDVTFALCYDIAKYKLPKEGITCGFYFGTGIGNALTVDGKPLVGKNGAAGELGHIPALGSELPCGCGNAGCVENLAGGKYLARLQSERYPDTPIAELFARHGGEAPLREFVDTMAAVVATEINILDPEHVLVGGGVANMKGFPRHSLDERIRARVRKPLPEETLHIIYTDDEPDKSVVGAAIYVRDHQKRTEEGRDAQPI